MKGRNKENLLKELLKFNKILDYKSMADIVLVWSGFKPTAMVAISYLSKSGFSKKEFLKSIDNLKNILNGLKLKYQLNINYPKSSQEITKYSYITKTNLMLKKIIIADTKKNTKQRRLKTGKLLGYPISAVNAFAKSGAFNCLGLQNLPPDVLKNKYIKFLNFRLSKKNWKKEMEYVKKKAQMIKRISPELYKRIKGK